MMRAPSCYDCARCGAERQGNFMGYLGYRAHFCCRNCGLWYSHEIQDFDVYESADRPETDQHEPLEV